MHSAINGGMPSGLLGMLASQSATVRQRMDTLSRQAATGQKSETYAGLGDGAKISLDLRPQLQRIDTYTSNISQADTKLQMTGSALQQLSDIASNFATQTINMSAQTSPAVDSIAVQARLALQQVQVLLNSQSGGAYLFAGQDSANQPVPDTELAVFVAAVQAPVVTLTNTNATATAAATLAAATATTVTAATLGPTRSVIEADDGLDLASGVVAGQNAYAVQSGGGSTGSYVKDLIRGLATLAAMNSGQTALGNGFTSFVTNIGATLKGAVSAIGTEMAGIGQQQSVLSMHKTALSDTATALNGQISSVEDVDMAATATALSQVQTQLQASYKLIASMQTMSLVGYL
jgi:flagellar hook-associated protein 3 FlgL